MSVSTITNADTITILATTEFTASGEKLRDELRSYQGTEGINEWTASVVNYLHVGDWYFSASFSQSKAIKDGPLHSQPQTVGYEVICDRGRNFKTVKYVDEDTWKFTANKDIYTGSVFLNPITASIKSTRGVPNHHTSAVEVPGGPGGSN